MIKPLRPKLELLSKELILKITEEAPNVLENQGVFVENQEAIKLLQDVGMKVDVAARRPILRQISSRSAFLLLLPRLNSMTGRGREIIRKSKVKGDVPQRTPFSEGNQEINYRFQESCMSP